MTDDFDLEGVIDDYDFHLFVIERRDGSHFTGSLYKSRSKAENVAMKYMKDDPFHLKKAHILKIGVNPGGATTIDNPDWIEDKEQARKAADEKARIEVAEMTRNLLAPLQRR